MVFYKNLFEKHLYVNIFHDDSQNYNAKIASPDHDKVFRLSMLHSTHLWRDRNLFNVSSSQVFAIRICYTKISSTQSHHVFIFYWIVCFIIDLHPLLLLCVKGSTKKWQCLFLKLNMHAEGNQEVVFVSYINLQIEKNCKIPEPTLPNLIEV